GQSGGVARFAGRRSSRCAAGSTRGGDSGRRGGYHARPPAESQAFGHRWSRARLPDYGPRDAKTGAQQPGGGLRGHVKPEGDDEKHERLQSSDPGKSLAAATPRGETGACTMNLLRHSGLTVALLLLTGCFFGRTVETQYY